MRPRNDRTVLCALLIVLCAVSANAGIVNGYQAKLRAPHRTTSEPMAWFPECWFWPWSWCQRPADPKELSPDVPAGCCSDTCVGPCQ